MYDIIVWHWNYMFSDGFSGCCCCCCFNWIHQAIWPKWILFDWCLFRHRNVGCFLAFNSALPQYAMILAIKQPKNVPKHAHQNAISKLSERVRERNMACCYSQCLYETACMAIVMLYHRRHRFASYEWQTVLCEHVYESHSMIVDIFCALKE